MLASWGQFLGEATCIQVFVVGLVIEGGPSYGILSSFLRNLFIINLSPESLRHPPWNTETAMASMLQS